MQKVQILAILAFILNISNGMSNIYGQFHLIHVEDQQGSRIIVLLFIKTHL